MPKMTLADATAFYKKLRELVDPEDLFGEARGGLLLLARVEELESRLAAADKMEAKTRDYCDKIAAHEDARRRTGFTGGTFRSKGDLWDATSALEEALAAYAASKESDHA